MTGTLAIAVFLATAPSVDQTLTEIVAEAPLGFCTDAEYPLTAEEARWCGADLSAHCPTFKAACESGNRAVQSGLPGRYSTRERTRGSGSDSESSTSTEDAPDGGGEANRSVERDQKKSDDFDWPNLAGFAEVFFWLIIIAFGIGLLVALYHLRRGAKPPKPPKADDVPQAPIPRVTRAVQVAESARLWQAAEAAAARGEHDDALTLGHQAVLSALHTAGHVRIHRSKTNGEYLRQLREQPELRKDVRELVRSVEEVQFGELPADAGRWSRYADGARTLLTRLSAVLLVLGLGIAEPGCDSTTYNWGSSPSGVSVLMELGNRTATPMRYREAPLTELSFQAASSPYYLLLLRDSVPNAREWNAISTWVDAGGVLVDASGVDANPIVDATISSAAGEPISHFVYLMDAPTRIMLPSHGMVSTDTYDAGVVLEHADGAHALSFTVGNGQVVVVSDDLLFTNASMMISDNARVALAMFDDFESEVRVDVVDAFFWEGADSPAGSAASSEMTPLLGHILVALLLFALWRGIHFGRPREQQSQGRRAWSEHVEALGRQYARANDPGHALELYSRWALDVLGARASGAVEVRRATARIAAATDHEMEHVDQVLSLARKAALGDGPTGDAALSALDSLSQLVNITSAGQMPVETDSIPRDRADPRHV